METETKTQHTPGPWEAYTGHDGQFTDGPLIIARTREGMPDDAVATVLDRGRAFTLANAHLIAASPTMATYIAKQAALGDTEAQSILQEIGYASNDETPTGTR